MLACYYVLIDAVLMFQCFFYKILFPPRPQTLIPTIGTLHSHSQHQIPVHTAASSSTASAPVNINRIQHNRSFQRSIFSVAVFLGFIALATGSPLHDIPDEPDTTELVGQIFAWICCAFYLTSRLPQILENHRRKSTQGINIALFTAALCGNSCYTIGILTNPLAHKASTSRDFLWNAFPYLLGSAGCNSNPIPLTSGP
jgi:uncharacterized protein with PQ loop repeat